MVKITEYQMTIELGVENKPKAYSDDSYPFENLDDRLFEILTYYVIKEEIRNLQIYKERHNRITLMPGV